MEANVVVHNGPRIFMRSNLIFLYLLLGQLGILGFSLGIAFNQGLG